MGLWGAWILREENNGSSTLFLRDKGAEYILWRWSGSAVCGPWKSCRWMQCLNMGTTQHIPLWYVILIVRLWAYLASTWWVFEFELMAVVIVGLWWKILCARVLGSSMSDPSCFKYIHASIARRIPALLTSKSYDMVSRRWPKKMLYFSRIILAPFLVGGN